MYRVLMGTLIIVLALALAGCGGEGQKAEVNVDDGKVTVTTDDGQATITGGKNSLAEGFPEDFPIYAGAEVESSAVVTVNGQTQYTAALTSSASVREVYDWYKAQLTTNGWNIVSDAQVSTGEGATSMLSAKRSGMQATMGATTADGTTNVAVTIVVEE